MRQEENNCVNFTESATVGQCPSTPATPIVAPVGPLLVNTPVLLAEVQVTTNLRNKIRLPEPALEIKDNKYRVRITQCRVIPPQFTPTPTPGFLPAGTVVNLFIEGVLRKNIQYASPVSGSTGECIDSNMRSFTPEIPFDCVTPVTLTRAMQIPATNSSAEYDFYREQNLGTGFPEKDQLLSSDLSQFHQVNTQFYNKLPHCELVSHNINSMFEATNRTLLDGAPQFGEGTFTEILEKTFLQFTLKVLQEQQVLLTSP